MEYWGQELTIDGFTSNIGTIQSKANITEFVEQLVKDIDMVSYGPLWIERFATHDPIKAGISFIQMIETSNICGHFVDVDGSFYLNIFSCKDFDVSTVLDLVCNYFETEEENLHTSVTVRDVKRNVPNAKRNV